MSAPTRVQRVRQAVFGLVLGGVVFAAGLSVDLLPARDLRPAAELLAGFLALGVAYVVGDAVLVIREPDCECPCVCDVDDDVAQGDGDDDPFEDDPAGRAADLAEKIAEIEGDPAHNMTDSVWFFRLARRDALRQSGSVQHI